MFYKSNGDVKVVNVSIFAGLIIVAIIVALMAVLPQYGVWQRELRGRAALAEAEYDKQIITVTAQAQLEAERLNAEAEIIRAQGMAEAIAIEGGMLTPLYIHYLWVRTMAEHGNVIYVPTEANLPLLEAVRGLPLIE